MNRRSLLKSIGTSTAGIGITTGLASGRSGRDVRVRIDPARDSDTKLANNEIYDALDNFLGQLESNGAIPGYGLSTPDRPMEDFVDDPGRSDDKCSPGGLYDNYVDWTEDHGYFDVALYVTDESFYGGGEVGSSDGVWTDPRSIVWVGTSGNYNVDINDDPKERMKNAAIQEVGHTLIDPSKIDSSDKYTGGEWHDAEHALGRIESKYGGYWNPATPMLVYYENSEAGCRDNDLSGKGCHAYNDWDKTHTQEVTGCTIDAVRDTFDAHWG